MDTENQGRQDDRLSFFCSVSTMKSPSVKTSGLRNWVEANEQMGLLFGNMTPFLNLPLGLEQGEYRRVDMHDLGECAAYNQRNAYHIAIPTFREF